MSKSKRQGTREAHHSHTMGLVGEAEFIAFAASQGWQIFRGMSGHEPFDFVVDDSDRLLRVEVKAILSVQRTQGNYYYVTATKFDSKLFDYLFIHTPAGNYWIPADECPASTISIKQVGGEYDRNITAPGKYEEYRV